MAETYTNGILTFKDAEGNVVTIRSLSANDIAKIKSYVEKTDTIESSLSELQTSVVDNLAGVSPLAYADYTETENQGDMVAGVYYRVPFNAADQFIAFDAETGTASATQAADVTDTTVSYFKIVYKNSSGVVTTLGTIDMVISLSDYYTKTEVDSAISTAVGEATGSALSINILDQAPTSELVANVLYAYPAEDSI